MSRYHGSLLCQVAGLVALLVITGTLVLLPRHSAVADEGAIDPLAIEFRKSNVTTRYPKGDGSLDASMRDRNLSWERRTRRLLA